LPANGWFANDADVNARDDENSLRAAASSGRRIVAESPFANGAKALAKLFSPAFACGSKSWILLHSWSRALLPMPQLCGAKPADQTMDFICF
jgi:hypothetical protein